MKTAILAAIVAILIAAMQLFGLTIIDSSANEYTANPSEITNNNNIDVNTNNSIYIVPPDPPRISGTTGNPSFEDYFGNDESRWETYPNDLECVRYIDRGKLKFDKVSEDSYKMYDCTLNSFTPYRNFIVEFDAKIVHDNRKHGQIGIIFRRIDENNYYRFLINRDGEYSFQKIIDGEDDDDESTIIDWTSSPLIIKGTNTNTIGVKCEGVTFTFYSKNKEITHCTDSTFATGGIALVAGVGSNKDDDNKFSFDNLKIWNLNISNSG